MRPDELFANTTVIETKEQYEKAYPTHKLTRREKGKVKQIVHDVVNSLSIRDKIFKYLKERAELHGIDLIKKIQGYGLEIKMEIKGIKEEMKEEVNLRFME